MGGAKESQSKLHGSKSRLGSAVLRCGLLLPMVTKLELFEKNMIFKYVIEQEVCHTYHDKKKSVKTQKRIRPTFIRNLIFNLKKLSLQYSACNT